MENFKNVLRVKKELSEEQFKRAIMIILASTANTPVDIVQAEFGPVKETEREFICETMTIEGEYSGIVGSKKFKNRELDIDLIDWMPYNGTIHQTVTAFSSNEPEPLEYYLEGIDVDRLIKNSIPVDDKVNICYEKLTDMTIKSINSAIRKELTEKFDGYKDIKNKNISPKEINFICLKVPFYEVEYKYNGKTYHACGLGIGKTTGESYIHGRLTFGTCFFNVEFPKATIRLYDELNKMQKERLKPLKIAKFSLWAACLISSVISLAYFIGWLFVIAIMLLIAAGIVTYIFSKKESEGTGPDEAHVRSEKYKALKAELEKNNYEGLEKKELSTFNLNGLHSNDEFLGIDQYNFGYETKQ